MTKLDWQKFEPLFGTWAKKIKPFFDRGGFDPIYEYLKKESKRGVKIAPLSNLVYRCFQETDIDNTHVILISMCPYHTFLNGSPVADGLTFSCSVTGRLQPSLEQVYNGLELELNNGLNLDYYKSPDLTYLSRQGILLFNSSLTVAQNKAGSHQEIWEPFTRYMLEDVFAYTGIPIVFIGKDAAKYKKYVSPITHGHIFEIEHPSFAARMNQDWDTKGVFTKINEIVRQNNGVKLKWLCSQEEIDEIMLTGGDDLPPF